MRCIDPEGEQLGVIDTFDAIRKAEEFGLDLVEVQPNVDPPVCKILDYGKFKYEAQKRANEAAASAWLHILSPEHHEPIRQSHQ